MKALTVRQPWAALIVNGVKHIETRTRATSVRGRIGIIAGKHPMAEELRVLGADVIRFILHSWLIDNGEA